MSIEQEARDLLEAMGIDGAQSLTAGDLVLLAEKLHELDLLRDAYDDLASLALAAMVEGHIDLSVDRHTPPKLRAFLVAAHRTADFHAERVAPSGKSELVRREDALNAIAAAMKDSCDEDDISYNDGLKKAENLVMDLPAAPGTKSGNPPADRSKNA